MRSILAAGRGNREDVARRYVGQWIFRKGLQLAENALAALFKQDRCTITVAAHACEDWMLDDAAEPTLAKIADLFIREEELRRDRLAFAAELQHALGLVTVEKGRGWRTSAFAAAVAYMGASIRAAAGPSALEILEAEREAAALKAAEERGREEARAKASQRRAETKQRNADLYDAIRTEHSRFQVHEAQRVLAKIAADPLVKKAVDAKSRVLLQVVGPGQTSDAALWAEPVVDRKGERVEARLYAKSRPALENLCRTGKKDAPGPLAQAFAKQGFNVLIYDVLPASSPDTFTVLLRLTKQATAVPAIAPAMRRRSPGVSRLLNLQAAAG
ncbi:MAG: hypothetical protein AB7O04_07360 [Hyphomonadaceae bacterium]